jgi:hypothetical protein
MDVQIDRLIMMIGTKQVEVELLREQVRLLQAELVSSRETIASLERQTQQDYGEPT